MGILSHLNEIERERIDKRIGTTAEILTAQQLIKLNGHLEHGIGLIEGMIDQKAEGECSYTQTKKVMEDLYAGIKDALGEKTGWGRNEISGRIAQIFNDKDLELAGL